MLYDGLENGKTVVSPSKNMTEVAAMNFIKRCAALIIGIVIVSFGTSLTIQAAIGVGAYDAMALSVSYITGIKVGTISMVANGTCILLQLLIEKRDFKLIQLLQIGLVLLQGAVVNFFVYTVFADWKIVHYITRIPVLAAGYITIAFGITVIMRSDIIRNPLEGVSQLIADKRGKPMGRLRQQWDIAFVLIALSLAFFSRTAFTIREGTILGMLLFGPFLDLFKKPVGALYTKAGL